jgi:synaptobrevin homolog YKT6
MPIYSITLLNKATKATLSKITYLNDFNFWERPKVNEIIDMASCYITAKNDCNSYKVFLYEGYLCHVHITHDGLSGVLLSDEHYPTRVASESLYNYIGQFLEQKLPWKTITSNINYDFLPDYIRIIQNPNDIDKLIKIRQDIDDTREIIISNIEELLNRGDKLSELERRTETLLIEAEKFDNGAKSLNRCCVLL